MSDAWEILIENATDITDAWAALNSQECSGTVAGSAVNEIPFMLGGVVDLIFTSEQNTVTGAVNVVQIETSTTIPETITNIEIDQVTVVEEMLTCL